MKTYRSRQSLQKKQAKALMRILLVFRNYCDPELEMLITRYFGTGMYLHVRARDLKKQLKQQKKKLYSKQVDTTPKPFRKRLDVTFNYVRIVRRSSGWFLHPIPQVQQKTAPLLLLKQASSSNNSRSNFFLIADKKGKVSPQFKQLRCQMHNQS